MIAEPVGAGKEPSACMCAETAFSSCLHFDDNMIVEDDAAQLTRETPADTQQQGERDGGESGHESPPEAGGAGARQQTEVDADGHADEPETEQRDDHGRARVAGAAQHAGPDDLQAIEDLEETGDRKQEDGDASTASSCV